MNVNQLKQRVGAAVLLASLSVIPAGCSQAEPEEPVQITLMHGWGGSAPDHVAMREIYEDFNRQNPDIRLVYDASPDITIVLDKADDLLAVNRMPDIVSTNGYGMFVENACSRQKALDLAPYLQKDSGFLSDINTSVLETWMEPDGSIYTLPDVLEVAGYWYNASIFRAAGITEDGTPNTPVRLPETFEAFWEACDRIAQWAQEEGNGVVPMAINTDQAEVLMGARIAASSPEGAAFMQKKKKLCPEADVVTAMDDVERAYSYYNGPAKSVNDTRQLFLDGKSAVYFNGVWASVTFLKSEEQGYDFLCAPYPCDYGGKVAYISSSSGYVIGSAESSEKTGACVRFLRYMLSEDVQKRIAAQTYQVPSNPKVRTGWISQHAPLLGEAVEACYRSDVHILLLRTVLDEQSLNALDHFMGLSRPVAAAREEVLNALCRGKNITTS